MREKEFFDQKKWIEIHKEADQLIARSDGTILAALYKSPMERYREDYSDFTTMLREWALKLPNEPSESH